MRARRTRKSDDTTGTGTVLCDASPISSTSSSLVLGFAARLSPTFFEPFVRSLRATAYKGQIGFVLGHYHGHELRALESLVDFSVVVNDSYVSLPPPLVNVLRTIREKRRVRRAYPLAFSIVAAATRERAALTRWSSLEYHLEGLQALRYGHYYDIVRTRPDADQVLLTDVRDVIFQCDPFDPPVEGLEVFLEDRSVTLGMEPRNRRWIDALYGKRETVALRDEVVSCSGTVVGRRDDILHYLREMSQAIVWRRRPLGSHDQGVHNHLLRHERLGAVTVVRNGHGRVLTMGELERVRRDCFGHVVNDDGSMPAVLHQYDRHADLATELIARLGGPESR